MKTACRLLFLTLTAFVLSAYAAVAETQTGYIENKGQVTDQNGQPNPSVRFLLNTPGLNVQLRAGGFSYDTYTRSATQYGKTEWRFHRVDIDFTGACSAADMVGMMPSGDAVNYYLPHKSSGVQNVRTFAKVLYRNLYPGIDLEFTTASSKPKFNFIVHPGADASLIRWTYTGAFSASLIDNSIVLRVEAGSFAERIPESFLSATQERLNVSYTQAADHSFGFALPAFDRTQTLVIDPTPQLIWGTYYGGTLDDNTTGIRTDKAGYIYVSGYTVSSGNIATSGTHQSTRLGNADAFTARFHPTGTRIWATYFGGFHDDKANGLALDAAGNVHLAGMTQSPDSISSPGAHQPAVAGAANAFIVKLSNSGIRTWATYFGGETFTEANGIAVDSFGRVYITGTTYDSTGIATSGAFDSVYSGGTGDAYLARFSSSGSLDWATYIGDTSADAAFSVSTDRWGRVLVAGTTASPGLATSGAHQQTLPSGSSDAFVARFEASGTPLWLTYYGDAGGANGLAVSSDRNGNVLLAGSTIAPTAIASPGAHQTAYGGLLDAYIVKFDSTGARQWGTYYGGTGDDVAAAITADDSSNVLVCGRTSSTTAISTGNSHQSSLLGSVNAFAVKMNASGVQQWGTYYGGSAADAGTGIAADTMRSVFICGNATSSASIASTSSHQPSPGGGRDGFIAKLVTSCPGTALTITANSATSFCNGDSVTLSTPGSGWDLYQWKRNFIDIPSITSPSYKIKVTGIYSLAAATYTGCSTASNLIVVSANPIPTAGFNVVNPVQCLNTNQFTFANTSTIATGAINFKWDFSNGDTSTATSPVKTFGSARTYSVKLVTVSDFGCRDSVTKTVTVVPKPMVGYLHNASQQCLKGNLFTFNDTSTITGPAVLSRKWKFGPADSSTSQNAAVAFSAAGTYSVKLVVTSDLGCKDSVSGKVTVFPQPGASTIPAGTTAICNGDSLRLQSNTAIGYRHQWYRNGFITSPRDTFPLVYVRAAGNYHVVVKDTTGCADTSAAVSIQVNNAPPAIATAAGNTSFCQGGSVTLNATAGTGLKYQWKNGTTVLPGDTGISIQTGTAGNYRVIVTDTVGCSDSSAVIAVEVFLPPNALATPSGPPTFCIGDSVSIFSNAGTGLHYQWRKNLVDIPGAIFRAFTTRDAGSFTVIVTDTHSCVDSSAPVIVSVNPKPVISGITGPLAVTSQNTVAYSVQPQSGFTWFWTVTNGSIITGQGTESVDVFWPTAGKGTVTIRFVNSTQCQDTMFVETDIKDSVVATAVANYSLFPSPVKDLLTVQSSESLNGAVIEFTDMVGRVALEHEVGVEVKSIDIELLPLNQGYYTVRILRNGDQIHRARIFKR